MQLQRSLPSIQTFCKRHVTLHTLFEPLPRGLKELQEIWEGFSPKTAVAEETITDFTERLAALRTDLNEFKITQDIFKHLDCLEENHQPISISSTVTKIRKMHHLIQKLTNVVEADPLFATHRLEQEIVNLAHLIQTFQGLGIEPSVNYGLQSMMQELTENFSYLVGSPKE